MQNTKDLDATTATSTTGKWETLASTFQVDKLIPKTEHRTNVPFFVPEKKRRMNSKNLVDSDFVITVYLPREQRQHQHSIQGQPSDTIVKRGNSTKAGNLFKVYSYRSTEMPTSLQTSSSSSAFNDSSMESQSRNSLSPNHIQINSTPNTNNQSKIYKHPKRMKLKRDIKYSLEYILNREHQEIDRGFNPFV